MLWLNPQNVDTFPEGLLDALDDVELVTSVRQSRPDHSLEGRLKARMHADALQPVASLEEDSDDEQEKRDEQIESILSVASDQHSMYF